MSFINNNIINNNNIIFINNIITKKKRKKKKKTKKQSRRDTHIHIYTHTRNRVGGGICLDLPWRREEEAVRGHEGGGGGGERRSDCGGGDDEAIAYCGEGDAVADYAIRGGGDGEKRESERERQIRGEKLLNGIAERFDWDRIMEGDNIIGLKQGMQNISLEPGGQFELSGAPLETLHQTCAEVNSHLYQVKAVTEEMGIGFLGIGLQPKWGLKDTPIMPKGRYEILRNYLPKVGSLGLDVMFRTCSVQVNLDMIRKFRASLALQPIATTLFTNSPFTEGKPNGYLSMRSQAWTDMDNDRSGMIPFVFDDFFGFEQYVDYALDVPMWFVYQKKKYIDCSGLSFRVRMKRYLEMRGADVGPRWSICALPAFWVPKSGLKTPFRDGLLKHVAEDVVRFAKDGLERRGFKETGFLNEVTEVVRIGVTPAEKLLESYHGKWGGSVDPVFEELQY
ncbi:hypothetical protein ACSBR1_041662 [Camellia fascicularis]